MVTTFIRAMYPNPAVHNFLDVFVEAVNTYNRNSSQAISQEGAYLASLITMVTTLIKAMSLNSVVYNILDVFVESVKSYNRNPSQAISQEGTYHHAEYHY